MNSDAPVMVNLGARFADTEVQAAYLIELGRVLLDLVASTQVAGHSSPAHQLDYLPHEPSQRYPANDLVYDFVAWVGRRPKLRPGCEDRVRAFVADSDWTRVLLARRAEALGFTS